MFPMLLRQKYSLIEIAALAAHADCGIKVEVVARLDEGFELLCILELGIAI